MRLDTFFDNFELMADAPNGVQKLREMILQLAVRGKLVPQDLEDEPASVLVEKIGAEKERLIKEKKLKRTKPLPPIRDNEVPYVLPEGWVWCKLGNISNNIHYGYTASANNQIDDVRLLRITDIQNGQVNWENVPGCKIDKTKIDYYRLKTGDLLIARTGGTIGKTFLIENTPYCTVFASYLIRIVPSIQLHAQYLKYFAGTPLYWQQLYEKSSGTGQPNVNATSLKSLIIPIPPYNEQKRIATKVDQIMTLCDKLETRQQKTHKTCIQLNQASVNNLLTASQPAQFNQHWRRIRDNFDLLYNQPENVAQLRQAILQLAVQGKLVPQDPNDEPASVLLQKIQAEKERLIKDKQIKKTKPLPAIDDDEVPYGLPVGWVWVRLRNICHNLGQKKPDEKFTYIDVSSINKEKGIISDNIKLLEPTEAPSRARKIVKKNTIIYSTVRPYLLNIAIIDKEFSPQPIVSTAFAVLHPFSGINNKYLYHYLRSQVFINYVEKAMTGMAYPAINDTKMNIGLVPLPPQNEQKRIIAKVDQLMALCDELESGLTRSQTDCERLVEAGISKIMAA